MSSVGRLTLFPENWEEPAFFPLEMKPVIATGKELSPQLSCLPGSLQYNIGGGQAAEAGKYFSFL